MKAGIIPAHFWYPEIIELNLIKLLSCFIKVMETTSKL